MQQLEEITAEVQLNLLNAFRRETTMFTQAELQSEQDIENFKAKLDKITDDNIHAAFEVFTVSELANKLLADELWFKLSDRAISFDMLEEELSKQNEIMLSVIRGESAIKDELEKMVYREIGEILADYEVHYVA